MAQWQDIYIESLNVMFRLANEVGTYEVHGTLNQGISLVLVNFCFSHLLVLMIK